MVSPATADQPTKGRRELKDLDRLPRSAALSTLRAAFERTGHDVAAHWPALAAFAPSAWREWLREYGSHVLNGRYPLPSYTESPTKCVYPLRPFAAGQPIRVSLAGDWGTGTEEAEKVMEGMIEYHPDFTIHLGDVYYIGDKASIDENCLGVENPKNGFTPVRWERGNVGSFAMLGNHEIYATGKAYVRTFLPTLGLIENGTPRGQTTSFFCLENDDWRIIALDTGYNSRGLPLLNFLPEIPVVGKLFWFLRPSCKLTENQLEWLRNVIRPDQSDGRGIILLSHHQYFTLFADDASFTNAARQLDGLINRPAIWFWGHEHRMAGYELFGPLALKVHGRCLGNGGMPVVRRYPPRNRGEGRLLFYDNRKYKDGFGMNGYATLEFRGRHLRIVYSDLNRKRLVSEDWNLEANGGVIRAAIDQDCLDDNFYGPAKWGKHLSSPGRAES